MDYKDLSCGFHWTMWDTGPVKTKNGWTSRNLLPTSQLICGPNSTHLAKRGSRLKQPRLNQNLILTWFIQPVLQMSDPQKIMKIYWNLEHIWGPNISWAHRCTSTCLICKQTR
jgi:hypothetical protein